MAEKVDFKGITAYDMVNGITIIGKRETGPELEYMEVGKRETEPQLRFITEKQIAFQRTLELIILEKVALFPTASLVSNPLENHVDSARKAYIGAFEHKALSDKYNLVIVHIAGLYDLG